MTKGIHQKQYVWQSFTLYNRFGWLVVFYVPSTAMSFRDDTSIYCTLRRTWSLVNTLFPPGIEPGPSRGSLLHYRCTTPAPPVLQKLELSKTVFYACKTSKPIDYGCFMEKWNIWGLQAASLRFALEWYIILCISIKSHLHLVEN